MANKEKNNAAIDLEEYEALERVLEKISKIPEPYLSAALKGNVEFFHDLEYPNLEKKLHEKFLIKDIEWVIVNAFDFENSNGHFIKAFAQPYIKKESAERRADIVFGAMNWRNDYNMPDSQGRFKYKIELRKDSADLMPDEENEWVPKVEGGSIDTNARGGFSDKAFEVALSFAEKRAWAKVGIGRYLKLVPQIEVRISTDWQEGWNKYSFRSKAKGSKDNPVYINFYWEDPQLPQWALNEEEKNIYANTNPKSSTGKQAPTETKQKPKKAMPAGEAQWELMLAYYNNMPETAQEKWHNYLFEDQVEEETGEVTGSTRRNLSADMASKIIASLEKGYGELNEDNIPEAFVGKKKAEQATEEDFTGEANPDDEEIKNMREQANEKKP